MTSKKEPHTKVDELKQVLEGKQHRGKAPRRAAPEKACQNVSDEEGMLEELTSQLQFAEEDAKNHYDKMLRTMAELENYKKRTEREKQEVIRYSNESLITDLLPILDDLDRVLDHVPEGASKELVDFVSGVDLVKKHFLTLLDKNRLKEVETKGKKFDPEIHEAVAHVPSDDVEEDHVVETHRKGYILNGRLIRPAMVTVSKGRE